MLSPRSVLSKTRGEPRERPRINSLSTIPEQPSMTALPPWDRVSDAAFRRRDRPDAPSCADKFVRSVALLYTQAGRTHTHSGKRTAGLHCLLRLPATVRLQIYGHLLGTQCRPRPIRMNPMVFNRPVWSGDAFDTLEDVLAPLRGALVASFALRAELLSALFLMRAFHVTYSPYVRPSTCPLAIAYMHRYGCLMQRITLELDCTRLGYGMDAAAARLAPGTLHMDKLVRDFVAAQKKGRSACTSMDHLVVLCRRFYGSRPGQPPESPLSKTVKNKSRPSSTISPAVPYVGPEHEQVAQQLAGLAGLVDAARIVGFSGTFAAGLIQDLSGNGSAKAGQHVPVWNRTPSDAYALLPGQQAYLDYGLPIGVQLSSYDTGDADSTDASSTSSQLSSPSRASTVTTLPDKSICEEKLSASILTRALESVAMMQPKKLQKRRPLSAM